MHVSVILNAHAEGCLAQPTIRSLQACQSHALKHDIHSEVVVILDSADTETVEQFEMHGDPAWRLEHTAFSDLGQARNHGIRQAQGRFTAFLDADDLFGANWLTAAHEAAIVGPHMTVWHPELNVYFGRDERIFLHTDTDDEDWADSDIVASNHWTALVFAPTDLLLRIPYPASDLRNQIGYEDWGWNEATIGMGVRHKRVPDTAHFIRVKRQGSLLAQANAARSIPMPSGLLLRKKALQLSIDISSAI